MWTVSVTQRRTIHKSFNSFDLQFIILTCKIKYEVNKLRTTVTKRAQTAVPAFIRERYNIQGGDFLEWIDDGQVIKIIPIPADPIKALRGSAKGERLTERLFISRQKDSLGE